LTYGINTDTNIHIHKPKKEEVKMSDEPVKHVFGALALGGGLTAAVSVGWYTIDTYINTNGINDHFNAESIEEHAQDIFNTDEGAYVIHNTATGENTLLLVDEAYYDDWGYDFATYELAEKQVPESITTAFNDFKQPYIKAGAELPNFVSYRLTTDEPSMGADSYDQPTVYKLEALGLECYFANQKTIGDHRTPVKCHEYKPNEPK
jgi:hypothetical protein